jgi:hypothetical protein
MKPEICEIGGDIFRNRNAAQARKVENSLEFGGQAMFHVIGFAKAQPHIHNTMIFKVIYPLGGKCLATLEHGSICWFMNRYGEKFGMLFPFDQHIAVGDGLMPHATTGQNNAHLVE